MIAHNPEKARKDGYDDTMFDGIVDGPECQCDECIAAYDKGMNVAWLEMVEEMEFPDA